MSKEKLICLIGQLNCGRVTEDAVCSKCGMDGRVVYPGQSDLEAAQAAALVRYGDEVKRTSQQESADYEAAHGDLGRLMEFVDKWPSGSLVGRANAEIQDIRIKRERLEEEGRKWDAAVKADSPSNYSRYLEDYPEGRFSSKARAAIYSHRVQSSLYFAIVVVNVLPFLIIITFDIRGVLGASLLGLISSFASAWVAHEKGRRWWVGAILGFLLVFVGFVLVMLLPNRKSGVRCDGWKMGRVLNIVVRSLCLQFSPFFALLSQSWLGVMWPGLIFGYLWFNGFTVGMGKVVFGEMVVADDVMLGVD